MPVRKQIIEILCQFTDPDTGEMYLLIPCNPPHHPADRACVGCAAHFGNSPFCRRLNSCTPSLPIKGGKQVRLLKGRHVWLAKDMFDYKKVHGLLPEDFYGEAPVVNPDL